VISDLNFLSILLQVLLRYIKCEINFHIGLKR
jgi:hypothetical protein